MTEIIELFYVKRGKGDYRENLEKGNTPLISATSSNNGIIDHVDIEPTFKASAITVERVDGQAHVQLVDFATVPDDIAVLIPKEKMSLKKLYYIASQINMLNWKFNYARKLTPTRLKTLEIDLANFHDEELDLSEKLPEAYDKKELKHNCNYKLFRVTELFRIERGDFHALDRLDEGTIPTVSRISEDNGITGYYKKPNDAKIYSKGLLTVSTVSGDAFVQLDGFMATDNVLILTPKRQFRTTTLFFIQFMINSERWRFSYGRQPYKRVFSKTEILLPIKNGEIDEDYIQNLVLNCYGWDVIENHLKLET